jgi:hypothetical protein
MTALSTAQQPTATPNTVKAPTADSSAIRTERDLNTHHPPTPRSGAWPRHIKVEITRINNRLNVALVGNSCPRRQAVADAIRTHLSEAEAVIQPRHWFMPFNPVDWWRGTSIEQAHRSLHAARVFLVELVGDEDVDALLPGVLARVQSCLPATDPQRIELEKLPNADRKIKRAKLIRALERGYAATDEAHANIRRFRNVLLCAAAVIAAVTFLLIDKAAEYPTAVPLCFQPDITTAEAATLPPNQEPGTRRTVCPSGEQAVDGPTRPPSGADVWIVAGLGLLGSGLASAVSVRKMASSAAPYDIPLALALLKVPMGALTALAGILLLGGGFVPGLSELDTQRQILAYALVFGYAQQLATRFLDDRAITLLAEVPSKHAQSTQTRSLPTPTTGQGQQPESTTDQTSASVETATGITSAEQSRTNGSTAHSRENLKDALTSSYQADKLHGSSSDRRSRGAPEPAARQPVTQAHRAALGSGAGARRRRGQRRQ